MLPAAVVILMVLVYAWRKGVSLSALGIGMDFLQVVSLFTSFGFEWPSQLTSLFNAFSFSSFNDQLLAPECSVGTWSFRRKCVYPLCRRPCPWLAWVVAAPPPPPGALLHSCWCFVVECPVPLFVCSGGT